MLTINIHSFSYKKKGYPIDSTGNGGGFCFDCRGILNPGRFEEYKSLTGKDIPVINFLETQTKMSKFIEGVLQIITISIDDYISRNFDNLQINFGCTGGQHRSVYAAEKIAEILQKKYPNTNIKITHIEQPQLSNQPVNE